MNPTTYQPTVPLQPTLWPATQALALTGGQTSFQVLPPLAPGDILTELFLLAQTVATTATAEALTFGLFATNDPPPDANTASLGLPVITSVTIPGDGQPVSATTNLFTFRALIPTLYQAGQQGRYLTIVVTCPADNVAGYASFGVTRAFRPSSPWPPSSP